MATADELADRLTLVEQRLEQLFNHLKIAPLSGESAQSVSENVMAEIMAGNRIEAVRIHQQESGLSLREAKNQVDALFDRK